MPIKYAKIAALAALVSLLVFAALGPAQLQLRSGIGWQIDHFVGYFALTYVVCIAWPRPLVVSGAFICAALLLEALQALTPDRYCDIQGAMYSAGGVVAAALPAHVCIRALGRLDERMVLMLVQRWPFRNTRTALLTMFGQSRRWVWPLTLPMGSLTASSVRAHPSTSL